LFLAGCLGVPPVAFSSPSTSLLSSFFLPLRCLFFFSGFFFFRFSFGLPPPPFSAANITVFFSRDSSFFFLPDPLSSLPLFFFYAIARESLPATLSKFPDSVPPFPPLFATSSLFLSKEMGSPLPPLVFVTDSLPSSLYVARLVIFFLLSSFLYLCDLPFSLQMTSPTGFSFFFHPPPGLRSWSDPPPFPPESFFLSRQSGSEFPLASSVNPPIPPLPTPSTALCVSPERSGLPLLTAVSAVQVF